MMQGLDAEELFHLGTYALRQGDPYKAIISLKECLDLDRSHTKAIYLLGASYAQVGMYNRAKELLQQAILLQPNEYTAVFQLGLLHLTSGETELAKSVWIGLDDLNSDHYLCLFKSAMLALISDNFSHCIALIDSGIKANSVNEPLNNDMLQVKASTIAVLASNETSAETPANHFALSGYQQVRDKN